MPEEDEQTAPAIPARRQRIWEIIFEAETPAGKLFDVLLLWAIALSVLAIMLESVDAFALRYGGALKAAEWLFTGIFTIEFFVRVWCVRRKRRYIFSFFGIIDIISLLPSYLAFVLAGSQQLVVIRIIRMLRVFRVLKMARHMDEAGLIVGAFRTSMPKVTVFLFGVLSFSVIMGTVLYMIEPAEAGFSSIPKGVYWSVVTLTTVGYGDIVPQTPVGQLIAAAVMILGYALLAVPAGIFVADVASETTRRIDAGIPLSGYPVGEVPEEDGDLHISDSLHHVTHRHGALVEPFRCPECGADGHRQTAHYCFSCGVLLRDDSQPELPIWKHSKLPGKQDEDDGNGASLERA